MPKAAAAVAAKASPTLVSHTGVRQRAAERSYGVAEADLTPALSWSKNSFINEMRVWEDGRAPNAPTSRDDDGTEVRGPPWRHEVSAAVFECASVNAAQALANWSKSRTGQRAGKPAGFPKFKSRHKTAPAFRLRAKYTEGNTPPVHPAGPRCLRLPNLGALRVHEHTGQLARLLSCVQLVRPGHRPRRQRRDQPGQLQRATCKVLAATSGRLTPVPRLHPDEPGKSRPPPRTTKRPRVGTSTRPTPRCAAGWTATKNHPPPRGGGQGKPV